ncbi:class I SAM-dependent methyltransferase [Nocardiopsis sp. NPDC050513]|uniref:class I SAM-dependent methyltransferase n=1 Tax=Nocardiopsis sp. NPDC050513 TaxID=3364338 RepID=UPI0037BE1CCE
MVQKVMSLLHETSPYERFLAEGIGFHPKGPGSDHPVFAREISRLSPELIVEVGTWTGASAMHMARVARGLGLTTEILCVDSFLGGAEHWTLPRQRSELRLEFGHPQIYRQFLANVVHAGLEEIITPFPCTSAHAARILTREGVRCDIVYLDAGHEYRDVLTDIQDYWTLVRDGGALIGNGFRPDCPGVRTAAREFGATIGQDPEVDGDKWVLRKD